MPKAKRVVFSFDERSLESLENLREEGNFNTLAQTVRESLHIAHALQKLAAEGFTEVSVRNPDSGDERVLVLPTLVGSRKQSDG